MRRVFLFGQRTFSDFGTAQTIHGYVRTLKAFASWLEREGYTSDNRFKKLKPPKVPKKRNPGAAWRLPRRRRRASLSIYRPARSSALATSRRTRCSKLRLRTRPTTITGWLTCRKGGGRPQPKMTG